MLTRFMADLGQAKLLDDVGPPEQTLLVNLETAIVQYKKQPVQDMVNSGQLPPDAPAPGGPSFLGAGGVPGVQAGPPPIDPAALAGMMPPQ
jgi:hypothetical protein